MHYEDPNCDLALPLDLCLSYFHGADKKDQKPRQLGETMDLGPWTLDHWVPS